ncbi:MAG: T9SS type A sorting domain-containing protein [Brumimicrobium sp.]|nr:T9SS type A sorting domain-containing protein [Brumimicrobium sp.]MCO5268395.1 T9SS type A sorting domain-containing protein [Brumimicrobium sp.]
MRKILYSTLIIATTLVNSNVNAQDCSSGTRYKQAVFTNVTKTADVKYGSNYNQAGDQLVDLSLDIYTPDGDTDDDRPVILLAHGGSFIGGNKSDMQTICEQMAKMGYVAVSIQYRLLNINPLWLTQPATLALEFKKEVARSMHDMKAAIRFLRKSAANGNPYGINSNIIIAGGSSAGAILADHVTYLNDLSKIPNETDLIAYINTQGGLEGNSGNPGYSSEPQMALSMCGALMDTTIVVAGQQPFFGVHTAPDQTVPYLFGQPKPAGMTVQVDLYGDSLIYKRALNQGVYAAYKNYETGGHCDFGPDFFDIMMAFVYDNVCVQNLSLMSNPNKITFSVYPNPATSNVTIDIPGNIWNSTVQFIDMTGRVVHTQTLNAYESTYTIDVNDFKSGIYTVRIQTEDGRTDVKKLVIE